MSPQRVKRTIARAARGRRARIAAGAVVATAAASIAAKCGIDRLRGGRGDGPSRAYRLKDVEAIDEGIRRIAAGRADDAIEQLESARSGDFARSVHETRKDLKKLRAVLRLSRDELGDEVYRAENERYRDVARRLSAARDAEVKLQTLGLLEDRFVDDLSKETVEPLRKRLEQEREQSNEQDDAEHLAAAAAEIASGRDRIPEWPLAAAAGDWKAIEPGVRRSYRRGRKRMHDTIAEPTAENVHEWRKRAKDLWYHLRIVRDAWPATIGPASDQAHKLADLLGDHHDLAVLAGDASDLEILQRCIERRQEELLDCALDLGHRLYAERSKAFSRRIGAYWEAWRPSASATSIPASASAVANQPHGNGPDSSTTTQ